MSTPGNPVVHFEIVGSDPAMLRRYYGALFGWEFTLGDASTEVVSAPGQYGFVDGASTVLRDVTGIPGGVAGGPGHEPRVLVYVGVDDVEAALRKAEDLGGTRRMGPEGTPGVFMVGHFTDPEGHLIGVAGTA